MHEGHRNRLVSKVKDGGIVYEHELMEILLFNSCPRKDLNATAHALNGRFGSVEGVLKAESGELSKVDGVGANMAEYLEVLGKALHAVRENESFAVAKNVFEFRKFVTARPAPETDCLELHCLDKAGNVRRIIPFKADEGLRAAPAETEILKLVSVHSPYGIFAAGRRAAGGRAAATDLDDELCGRVDRIAALCGACFYDYCIVGGDGEFYSYKMADRGVFAIKCAGDGYGE